MDLLYGIRMLAVDYIVHTFRTRYTDGGTDRQTDWNEQQDCAWQSHGKIYSSNNAKWRNIAGVQQAGMVSAVQLRDICDQLPVRLVRRQFLVRALPDDSISAEASRAVSTSSSLGGRAEHHWSRVDAVQLCSVDVRRRADCRIPRTTRSRLPGASSVTVSRPHHHCLSSAVREDVTAIIDCMQLCCAWEVTSSLRKR